MNIVDEKTISNAFTWLENAKSAYHLSANALIAAKRDLEIAKLAGLASGTIDGKNAELREAAARTLLADKYTALETAELNERNDRFEMELAQLEIERVKMLLRLDEITVSIPLPLSPA